MAEKRVTQNIGRITLADGKEYEVKPLLLSQAKKLLPVVQEIGKMGEGTSLLSADLLDKTIEVAYEILKRSIKDLTKGTVEDLVDLVTVREIFTIGFGSMITK